jgi:hypothetical protein
MTPGRTSDDTASMSSGVETFTVPARTRKRQLEPDKLKTCAIDSSDSLATLAGSPSFLDVQDTPTAREGRELRWTVLMSPLRKIVTTTTED